MIAILDLVEDGDAFLELSSFASKNKYSFSIDPLLINMIETGLSIIKIGDTDQRIKKKQLPKYPLYLPLVINSDDKFEDQEALLAFLKIFYQIKVIAQVDRKDNKYTNEYYFEDGVTRFVLREDIIQDYMKLFEILLKSKLISTNPLMDAILKTYPNNNISRVGNYNIWYADNRTDAKLTLSKLQVLINQGYFCVSNIAWKYDIKKISVEQAYTAYGFKQLGHDCTCIDKHYISPECTLEYSKTLNYSPENFYYIPIHGPLIMQSYLSEEFFTDCVTNIDNMLVPSVKIKLNFEPSRETQITAVIAYTQTMCNIPSLCNYLSESNYISISPSSPRTISSSKNISPSSPRNISPSSKNISSPRTISSSSSKNISSPKKLSSNEDISFCQPKSICTYVSCESMDNIQLDNKSLILKCGDINSLIDITNIIQYSTLQIKIKDVPTIEEGIKYRYERWIKNNENSLLLSDDKGYFVGSWNANNNSNKKQIKNINSKITELASKMRNYEYYGKGYEGRGFYEIKDGNNVILDGLLSNIPYEDFTDVLIDDLIFKIMGTRCFVYQKPNTLLLSVPVSGKKKDDIIDEIRKGYFLNEWGKNYLSLNKNSPLNSNLFKTS